MIKRKEHKQPLTVHVQIKLGWVDRWTMMVGFCCRAVGLGTSNCPYFGRHRTVYRLNSKCCRMSCSIRCCDTIVSWLVPHRLRACICLVSLNVEQCECCWSFDYRWSVGCALCALVHTAVHFQIASCCHCCCYCHSLIGRWMNEWINMKCKWKWVWQGRLCLFYSSKWSWILYAIDGIIPFNPPWW